MLNVLKPCPFCGNAARVQCNGERIRGHYVACYSCGALGKKFYRAIEGEPNSITQEQAAEWWNRRAASAAPAEGREVVDERAAFATSAGPAEGRKQAADTIRKWIRDHENELNYCEFDRIDAALDRFIDRLATAPTMSEAQNLRFWREKLLLAIHKIDYSNINVGRLPLDDLLREMTADIERIDRADAKGESDA